jgi:hypothetical protein
LILSRKLKQKLNWRSFVKYLNILLLVYILFNLNWGLNYDRKGIAYQLELGKTTEYSDSALLCLAETLHTNLNYWAERVDSLERLKMKDKQYLFKKGVNTYKVATAELPFLRYATPSIKPSLFSHLGHYFGFTGYINPFTNEAQVQTTLPVFRQVFVLHHEIAHQLGYGKEDEASFVAFLACRRSADPDIRYSMYYDLYQDAASQLIFTKNRRHYIYLRKSLHPRVEIDRQELIRFYTGKQNKIEPLMSNFYDQYLKMNRQPKGTRTYNEVVALLIAYMSKYGETAL